MLNLVIQTGRLTHDPEIRHTKQDQLPVTSFRLAVKRDYAKDGEPDTDFFTVIAWRSTAEYVCKHFQRGSRIEVVGTLQNRPWTDKDGNKREKTEIIASRAYFAGDKGKNENSNGISAENEPPISEETSFSTPPDFDPFS